MLKNVLCLLVFLVSTSALAEDAQESLISLLERVDTLSSKFEQRTYKETSSHVDVSSGKFQLEKPLKFNWTVVLPYEQQVISDGETLWIYDPDLEQATYQPLNLNIQRSPAMILVQPRDAISDQYRVFKTTQDKSTVFKLVPLDAEGTFVELIMVFEQDVISELRILDSLGQETVVVLSDVKTGLALEPAVFEFDPPPGTDLFEQM